MDNKKKKHSSKQKNDEHVIKIKDTNNVVGLEEIEEEQDPKTLLKNAFKKFKLQNIDEDILKNIEKRALKNIKELSPIPKHKLRNRYHSSANDRAIKILAQAMQKELELQKRDIIVQKNRNKIMTYTSRAATKVAGGSLIATVLSLGVAIIFGIISANVDEIPLSIECTCP